MKRIIIFASILLPVVILGSAVVYGENIIKTIQVTYRNISIQVNGKIVPSDQEPFIYQGHTFVPLRTIGEAMNKTVEWDSVKNQIRISDPDNKIVRLESFIELMNYFPDHFKIIKSDQKLTPDEIFKIEAFLKKIDPNETYLRLDLTKYPERSYLLKNNDEYIVAFAINTGVCIRYGDGTLYYMTDKHTFPIICGSSDGWIEKNEFEYDQQTGDVMYFLSYLTKINSSIIHGIRNRTKQITDLYTISLWI